MKDAPLKTKQEIIEFYTTTSKSKKAVKNLKENIKIEKDYFQACIKSYGKRYQLQI